MERCHRPLPISPSYTQLQKKEYTLLSYEYSKEMNSPNAVRDVLMTPGYMTLTLGPRKKTTKKSCVSVETEFRKVWTMPAGIQFLPFKKDC